MRNLRLNISKFIRTCEQARGKVSLWLFFTLGSLYPGNYAIRIINVGLTLAVS